MSKQITTLWLHIGDNGKEFWFADEPDVPTLRVEIGDDVETTRTSINCPPPGVDWRRVEHPTDNVWQRSAGGGRKVYDGADASAVLVPVPWDLRYKWNGRTRT
jgi:hypothetical protein